MINWQLFCCYCKWKYCHAKTTALKVMFSCPYLALCMSSTPFIFSSPSFSKYMSLLWRNTNQRRFQLRRESVDEPPPFLCSQPCFRASCLVLNHRKVSSFRTHQRRFHVFIRPPRKEKYEISNAPPSLRHLENLALCLFVFTEIFEC